MVKLRRYYKTWFNSDVDALGIIYKYIKLIIFKLWYNILLILIYMLFNK